MSQPDGGAAFPIAGRIDGSFQEGMSLRDFFAGMALQGLSSSLQYTGQGWSVRWDETTQEAYRAADAMIARQEV